MKKNNTFYIKKNDKGGDPPKDSEVVMKAEDLEALKKAFKDENEEKAKEIWKNSKEELAKEIAASIHKEMATRKSVEDNGIDLSGKRVDFVKSLEAKVAKTENNEWSGKLTDFEKELRYRNDALAYLHAVKKQVGDAEAIVESRAFKTFRKLIVGYNDAGELAKAFDNTAGNVLEWIPTLLSSRLTDKIEVKLEIANQFERIALPGSKTDIPRIDGFPTAFKGVIRTPTTESTTDTDKSSFDVEKIIAESRIAFESDEDSIIATMPLSERQLTLAIARGVDNAILNGDDSTTHMDADITSAIDVTKVWKGLRKQSIDNGFTFDVAGAWTLAQYRKWFKQLAFEFGSKFNELRVAIGKESFHQLRGLSDVTTVEKIGSLATIIQGELRALDGTPLIPTQHQREDLQGNSGKFVATATEKAAAQLFWPGAWGWGLLGGMRIETDRDVSKQEIIIVGNIRGDFQSLMDPALHSYDLARNITKT